jgi:hypothetical protein
MISNYCATTINYCNIRQLICIETMHSFYASVLKANFVTFHASVFVHRGCGIYIIIQLSFFFTQILHDYRYNTWLLCQSLYRNTYQLIDNSIEFKH